MNAPRDLLVGDALVANALSELALARGSVADEFIITVYLKGLEDLDATLVARACDVLAKLPRAAYDPAVPAVGTIREHCAAIARQDAAAEARRRLAPMPHEERPYHCPDCRDESSGWRPFWCQGAGASKGLDSHDPMDTATRRTTVYYCGRKHTHHPHSYVDRCGCYGTNPVIAARRDASVQRREEKRR